MTGSGRAVGADSVPPSKKDKHLHRPAFPALGLPVKGMAGGAAEGVPLKAKCLTRRSPLSCQSQSLSLCCQSLPSDTGHSVKASSYSS